VAFNIRDISALTPASNAVEAQGRAIGLEKIIENKKITG